ncbi:MAG: efflux RND transporter periplasmic adaptor subunit [Pirellulaceae bacterium]
MSERQQNISGRVKTCWLVVLVVGLFAAGLLGWLAINGWSGWGRSPAEPQEDAAREKTAVQNARTVTEVKLAAEAVERSGIRVELAEKRTLAPTFRVPARVSFNEEAMAQVGTSVPGRVVELKVKLGDVVRRDDVLLLVESPQLGEAQSDYLQKRTAVAVATASLQPVQSAHQRAKNLHEQGQAISGAEVQKREAEYLTAQGVLQAAQSALAATELKLQMLGLDHAAIENLKDGKVSLRYSIRAPMNGTVVARKATLGELVAPEKDSLLVLADMTTLWVLADVPEAQLQRVAKGTKALVCLAVANDDVIEGTVLYIASNLDPSTRSAQVRIEVSGQHRLLKPGMFAEAELFDGRAEYREPVLAVPDTAVQTVEGRAVVFTPVPKKECVFIKREVQVGTEVSGMVPILAGISPGEKIVTQGAFILKAELGKAAAGQEDNE